MRCELGLSCRSRQATSDAIARKSAADLSVSSAQHASIASLFARFVAQQKSHKTATESFHFLSRPVPTCLLANVRNPVATPHLARTLRSPLFCSGNRTFPIFRSHNRTSRPLLATNISASVVLHTPSSSPPAAAPSRKRQPLFRPALCHIHLDLVNGMSTASAESHPLRPHPSNPLLSSHLVKCLLAHRLVTLPSLLNRSRFLPRLIYGCCCCFVYLSCLLCSICTFYGRSFTQFGTFHCLQERTCAKTKRTLADGVAIRRAHLRGDQQHRFSAQVDVRIKLGNSTVIFVN
jgi:hypothetical protein